MSLPKADQFLNSFINYEKKEILSAKRKWNLRRMRYLLKLFHHPEKHYEKVIIAGTKGKGSTGYFLESLLESADIPCGFYTSPHLETPRERVRIRSRMISERLWRETLFEIQKKISREQKCRELKGVSYFEIMTLLAAVVFQKADLKVAIFEVGLGGRLDATNALGAKIALITPIHMDHAEILGDTIAKIAKEKAGVISAGAEVIMAKQVREARGVLLETASSKKARLFSGRPLRGFQVGLQGDYQRGNASTALRAFERLSLKLDFPLSEGLIRKGLRQKDWPSRLEKIRAKPDVIIDAAHNPISTKALVRNLKKLYPRHRAVLFFSAQRDKDVRGMLKALRPYFKTIYLLENPSERSMTVSELHELADSMFEEVQALGKQYRDVPKIISQLKKRNELAVITGSFYIAGELRRILKDAKN